MTLTACGPADPGPATLAQEGEADATPAADATPVDAAVDLEGQAPPPRDAPMSVVDHTAFMDVLLDETGRSPALAIPVPVDAVSLSIVVRGSADLVFVTESVVDPRGRAVVSPDAEVPADLQSDDVLLFPAAFFSPNRAYWAPGAAVTLIPNNPEVELLPGTWRVRVAAVDALGWPRRGIVDVRAQIKRRRPGPAEHQLAIHFYFSGSGELSAAWAARDPGFRRTLESLAQAFRGADVHLGALTFQDVDARWQRVDADRDLAGLYALSEYDYGVHVFLVDRIENDGGDVIGGLSGGVPGPSGMPGSPRSGVVVAHTLELDPERVGLMIAHEVGHYLGLFHTAEMIPGYVDQIPDTPADDRARQNVMWPVVGDAEQRFTPEQAAVLVRGPAVLDVDGG